MTMRILFLLLLAWLLAGCAQSPGDGWTLDDLADCDFTANSGSRIQCRQDAVTGLLVPEAPMGPWRCLETIEFRWFVMDLVHADLQGTYGLMFRDVVATEDPVRMAVVWGNGAGQTHFGADLPQTGGFMPLPGATPGAELGLHSFTFNITTATPQLQDVELDVLWERVEGRYWPLVAMHGDRTYYHVSVGVSENTDALIPVTLLPTHAIGADFEYRLHYENGNQLGMELPAPSTRISCGLST